MNVKSVVCVLAVLLAGSLLADTVLLTDGRQIVGKIVDQPNPGVLIIETSGGRLEFKSSEVEKIEVGPAAPPAAANSTTKPALSRTDPPATKPDVPTVAKDDQSAALLARADAQQDVGKAWALYQQARQQNPKTLDIPKAMARRFQDQPDHRFYGLSLGYILALDANNVEALNNSGVIAALDKNWAQAIKNLAKAAIADKGDLPLQNLSQVVYMTQYAEETDQTIVRKGDWYDTMNDARLVALMRTRLAFLAAQEHTTLKQVVENLHQQKKHLNEELWDGDWMPKADTDAIRKHNSIPMNKIGNAVHLIKAVIARNDVGDTTADQRQAVYGWVVDLHVGPEPERRTRVVQRDPRLVLIDNAGGEVKSFAP